MVEKYRELAEFLDKHDRERAFRFSGRLRSEFEELVDDLKESFVLSVVGEEVKVLRIV